MATAFMKNHCQSWAYNHLRSVQDVGSQNILRATGHGHTHFYEGIEDKTFFGALVSTGRAIGRAFCIPICCHSVSLCLVRSVSRLNPRICEHAFVEIFDC